MRPLLLAMLLAAPAAAQVNTERLRTASAADGPALALDASAAYATGNTEYLQVGVGGRVDARLGAHTGFVVGRLDLGRTDGTAFVDRSFAHARLTTPLRAWLAAEAFTQVERNRQQRLDARTLAGAGLRASLVEADSAALAVGLTPMLEVETLDEALGGEQDAVVRVSTYLSGRVAVGPRAAVSAVVYAQPRADAFGDVRLLGQAGIDVGLTRSVALRVRLNVRHDSRPPDEVERTDVSVENGLVIVLPAP